VSIAWRRWLPWIAVALVVVEGTYLLGTPAAPAGSAPRFVAQTLTKPVEERTMDDYRGSPLLVNVWATWCDPCREEMPSLERLYREYRDRGLRVVAISIDDGGQVDLINEFVGEHGLTFDVLHDPKSAIMRQYPVRGVPQTFLVSRDGEIIATRYAEDWYSAANRALVDSLLLRQP
jgi:thiol-disulfide isomerase/thioredoxin